MSRMPKWVLAGALGLAVAACTQDVPTIPNIEQNVNVIIGTPPTPVPSATPTPIAGCPVVASVTVGFSGAGGRTTTRVGVGEVLDVTPRAGDRSEVPSQCHGSTVNWTINGVASGSVRAAGDPWTDPNTNPPGFVSSKGVPATCQLTGDLHGFNPHVTCSSPGTMDACAEVSAPGGRACTIFTVNP